MAALTDKNRGPFIDDHLYQMLKQESANTSTSIKAIVHEALENHFHRSQSTLSGSDSIAHEELLTAIRELCHILRTPIRTTLLCLLCCQLACILLFSFLLFYFFSH